MRVRIIKMARVTLNYAARTKLKVYSQRQIMLDKKVHSKTVDMVFVSRYFEMTPFDAENDNNLGKTTRCAANRFSFFLPIRNPYDALLVLTGVDHDITFFSLI